MAQTVWAWSGSARELGEVSDEQVLASLRAHHNELFAMPSSASQDAAWEAEIPVLREALRLASQSRAGVDDWGLVFEYELPFEGGRRPDVLVMAGSTLFVLEFKETGRLTLAHADQAEAYARDIRDYHSKSRELDIVPVVVSSADVPQRRRFDAVEVAGTPEQLADVLMAEASGPQQELTAWLEGTYAPLPTIVEAARRIFRHDRLPRIFAAESAGVDETVRLVQELGRDARENGDRMLILIAGVPGAGKTLAGLRIVYEHHENDAPATFLSGNGPLVEVLQDALKSTVFVKDLHKAVHAYGKRGQTPAQHVIVFDEAQRAWDRDMMRLKRQLDASEPDVLIDAGARIPDWSAMVGLVGDGQEIHSGEEGGIGQWSDAIEDSDKPWVIHCPPRLATEFAGLDVRVHEELDLTRSLRSRRAADLHLWVSRLLGEDLEVAGDIASRLDTFPIRLFRDLDLARAYVRQRYAGEPGKLYGLLASSHAKNLAPLGVDNTFDATRRVRVARWFNDAPESERSGCQLDQPLTEFMCQGLEVDLPVVCWGSDMVWANGEWKIKAINRRIPLHDPEQIVQNTYRVLLTRGRDGIVVFVPPGSAFDATAEALQRAGATEVQEL
jgi:hypothetical protein